ncbi:MAG: hypothetical protein OXG08_02625 [Gammaproteobacteria bacterium]|nr:hypothetical protein [Gammaproteobacteria bacterium]
MKPANLWSLAVAEIRSCRRLVRTWVFIAIAAISCIFTWLGVSFAHAATSTSSAAASLQNAPMFLIGQLSQLIIGWFTFGIVFLAFDIRARDLRDRIGEVIDARAVSNLEFVAGRLMGIVMLLGSAAALIVLAILAIGSLTTLTGAYIGGAIEPTSALAFLVWDIVPSLAFWGSLTIFLAVLVRYRILVILIVAILASMYFWAYTQLPHVLGSILSMNVGINVMPSEVAPIFVTTDLFLNRIVVLLLAGGLIAAAAAIHPRLDYIKNRLLLGTAGSVCVALGLATIVGLIYTKQMSQERLDRWASVHAEFQNHSFVDVEKITGAIEIFPGSKISLDLILDLSSSGEAKNDVWVFSLNPGYRISEVAINGSTTNNYTFEDGLLRILDVGAEPSASELRIVAKGVPDPLFAYLDSKLDLLDLNAQQVQLLGRLGVESYIFHPKFVALLPGVRWLPSSGAAYGRSTWEVRPQDFFALDIEVTVPNGWIVAGPGTRERLDQSKRSTFRFNPNNPVPKFALIGSKFERRSLEVNGVEFELLVSKKHAKSLRYFEQMGPVLTEWIQEKTEILSEVGLEYPYGTLSFVEVPVRLQVYEGGWRADSVFTQPGIQLIRESGFPIARFENVVQMATQNESEEDLGKRKLVLLERFFEQDPHGGNPLSSVSQNLVNFQTMPEGRGAIGLKYVVKELATQITTNSIHYFSIYRNINPIEVLGLGLAGGFFGVSGPSYGEQMRNAHSGRNSVWEHALATSLADIDYEMVPEQAYHVLLLKGNAIAQSLVNDGGREAVSAFLGELVSRYRGSYYTKDQFLQTALDVGLDMDHLVGDWLDTKNLPGFVTSKPKLERLRDTQYGESVYQTSFVLRNDEPAPGNVNIAYASSRPESGSRQTGVLDTIRVEGNTSVRIAFRDRFPPASISIDPLLSHNRLPIVLTLPDLEDFSPTDSLELPLIEQVDWAPPYADAIIVDDLDEGFSIIGDEAQPDEVEIPRLLGYFLGGLEFPTESELDSGLPSTTSFSLSQYPWTRSVDRRSYGKYRFTFALKQRRSADAQASFKAVLPEPGLWSLAYHVPDPTFSLRAQSGTQFSGSVSFGFGGPVEFDGEFDSYPQDEFEEEIDEESTENEEQPMRNVIGEFRLIGVQQPSATQLDLASTTTAVKGWNEVGQFEISDPQTEVEVVVVDGTPGSIFADAVMWRLIED